MTPKKNKWNVINGKKKVEHCDYSKPVQHAAVNWGPRGKEKVKGS